MRLKVNFKYKWLILTVAVAVLATGCQNILNSESVDSNKISEQNVETQSTVPKIEIKEAFKKEGSKYNLEFRMPVITNTGNTQVEKTINEMIEKDVKVLRDEIVTSRTEIENDPTLKDELDSPIFQYSASSELVSDYATSRFVSLAVGYSSYTGGAHGIYNVVPYNYSLSDGSKMKLVDFIAGDSSDIAIINKAIHQQVKENKIELYDDANPEINKDYELFYVTKDSLVIYYNTYAIAPYASGVLTFEVPLKELNLK